MYDTFTCNLTISAPPPAASPPHPSGRRPHGAVCPPPNTGNASYTNGFIMMQNAYATHVGVRTVPASSVVPGEVSWGLPARKKSIDTVRLVTKKQK